MVRIVLSSFLAAIVYASTCDEPELDLCDAAVSTTNAAKPSTTAQVVEEEDADGALRQASVPRMVWMLGVMSVSGKGSWAPLMMYSLAVGVDAAYQADFNVEETKCKHVKDLYKANECCGNAEKQIQHQLVPGPKSRLAGTNACKGKKPGFPNIPCFKENEDGDTVLNAMEQAGADVTKGHEGSLDSAVLSVKVGDTDPYMIRKAYFQAGLCPVNVHWHLGTEHRSAGEFDESGTSPNLTGYSPARDAPTRRLAGKNRYGFACSGENKFKSDDSIYTKEYTWQHCIGMHVGETYEVHWPHSALGACGTPDQYQTPFYDGVFCGYSGDGSDLNGNITASAVGVQSQVFVIVNDEDYYYPDLMRGMIVDPDHPDQYGKDIAVYTGSTTGTSRNNTVCSQYAPITWQVDRRCHKISASSFDKMCADMKQQRDDMTGDLAAHGSRVLVADSLTANNLADLTYNVPR